MNAESPIPFPLRGEYIPLDSLLKATQLASSGGEAKYLIGEGMVLVDGEPESRRTRKLRAGQRVQVGDVQVLIEAQDTAPQ
jgi:ribosome-associated protein